VQGKLRKPNTNEMDTCFDNFKIECNVLKPQIIFLLGKLISEKIKKILDKNIKVQLDNTF
jgi:uracil-DNA glycosylase